MLPILRLCQLHSQHQRLPVVWWQEMHLCVQQLQLCECYSRGRKSSFILVSSSPSLHPTSALFFFFLIKFWSGLTDLNLTFKWCTDYPLFSFSAVECEELPWVPSEEWAGVHQACKLQELHTESQLSVGPASVRVPRFTWWDNQNSYSKRTTHVVVVLLFFFFQFSEQFEIPKLESENSKFKFVNFI